jgi:hypothetical protein
MSESFLSTVIATLRAKGHTVAGIGRVIVPNSAGPAGADRTATLQVDGEHLTLEEAARLAGLTMPSDTTRTGSYRRSGPTS